MKDANFNMHSVSVGHSYDHENKLGFVCHGFICFETLRLVCLSFIQIYVFVIHSDSSYLRVNIIQIDKIFQVAEIVSEIDYKEKIVDNQRGLIKLLFSFR